MGALVERVEHFFRQILPGKLPGYEPREPQVRMAVTIAEALEAREHAIAEAGTGTGKSLAASVPGILYARDQGRPLIISTGTIALQEQYVRKDLPFLQETLGERFTVALAKGRGNYVCLLRLDEELRHASLLGPSPLLEWARQTTTGDMADYPGAPGEEWGRINVDETCTGSSCPFYGRCWYFAARRAAERAAVIVVNHALFMADLAIRAATRGNASLLPDPSAVIIDEAHHLETAAREAFGDHLPQGRVRHLVRAIRRMGLMVDDAVLRTAEAAYDALFDHLGRLVAGGRAVRVNTLPEDLVHAWDVAADDLNAALKAAADVLEDDAAVERVERLRDLLRRTRATVAQVAAPSDDGATVYWAERDGDRVVLHATPVDVSSLLRDHLFGAGYPVVLMSATLAVGGVDARAPFAHVRRRVGLDAARELRVESPFDYRSNCLLYVPRPERLPDPRAADYHERLVPFIEEILLATQGRAFVLFTSYRGLETVYEHLRGRLRYLVLRQGDSPKHELIRRFREDGNAVLFATASFWEGVDVPGEALSCVIIDRIPFAVPDDPVEQAVAEAVERAGGDPFWDIQLPAAIIRLKQGFGRLIRSKTDRGLVAILDKRLRERRYGRVILASLPPARRIETLDGVELWFAAGKGAAA